MAEPADDPDASSERRQLAEALEDEQAGRHATTLELFLDLVFVFAVSQLSKLIASDISGLGVARSALVAWLVWQLWSQFAWLGTSIDLDRDGRTRLAFVSSIVPTLFLAIAIPEAYGDDGWTFGVALVAGTVWVLGLQAMGLWSDPHTRRPFVRYASLAGPGPLFVLAGGFLSPMPRTVLWLVGSMVSIAGAWAANRATADDPDGQEVSWRVDPVHFAERHALFVIIVLGEVLVAIGVAATEHGLDGATSAAVVAAAWVAAVVWWAYFGFVSRFAEEALRLDHGVQRAALARDLFTVGHFPIVVGVAFAAGVIEHVVSHPTEHLHQNELWLLFTAVALLVGGFLGLQFRLRRRLAEERVAAIVVVGALLPTVGPHVDGIVVLAMVGLVLTVMQAITTWRVLGSRTP